MKKRTLIPLAGLLLASLVGGSASGQTLLVSDNYNLTGLTNGFALGGGVNTGINPPTTRLTGSVAANLRYYNSNPTGRPDTAYAITGNKIRVSAGAKSAQFSISANGTSAFDFGVPLAVNWATSSNKAVYDITISINRDNASAGTERYSFALSSAMVGSPDWDFGVQCQRTSAGASTYDIVKRIDSASSGVGDINAVIYTTAPNTWQVETNILMRVTDAGAETDGYNSQIQLSHDGGQTWFYDTATDPALSMGFRFDGMSRYIIWDMAGNAGAVTYDNFSVTWISGPPPIPPVVQTWTGGGADDNWGTAANWSTGTVPTNGDILVFNGAARQVNNNNLDAFRAASVTFSNGGFELAGNALTLVNAITNAAGNNIIGLNSSWMSGSAKSWVVGPGSQLALKSPVAIDVLGNHTVYGGGTLLISNLFQIGSVTPSANPAVVINDGRIALNGPDAQVTSVGGWRIGSSATTTLAETAISNGAKLYLNTAAGGFRVGDSSNNIVNRLVIDNGTLQMTGGTLGVPWVGGATSEVSVVNGTISGCLLSFNVNAPGSGTVRLRNSTLEPAQIYDSKKDGEARIYFDNVILRTPSLVALKSPFMFGLDTAEIQSGGLALEATTGDVVISSSFSGAGGLTKRGFYLATLTGTNTYAGTTAVQEGQLYLPTVQTNSGAIQVADAANLGVAIRAPGSTLTAGSLSIGGGSSTSALTFDLGGFENPTAPVMQVGSLTAYGTVTVNLQNMSAFMTPGTISLIKHTGGIGGGGTFVLGTAPGLNAQLVNNPGSLDLVISGVQGYRWTGATSGTWDAETTNWFGYFKNQPSAYADGFLAEFPDGAATGNVNVSLYPAAPAAMVVSNTTLAYTFSYGNIQTPLLRKAGAASLTRNDGGDTLQTVDVEAGEFVINRGSITAPVLTKTGPGALTRMIDGSSDTIGQIQLDEGSFVANSASDATFGTPLTDTTSGLGTFVKQGAGTLTVISNSSTFDGAIVIQEGVYKLGSAGALGSTNGTTTVRSGASLDMNNNVAQHERVIVSGAGVGGQGAIFSSGGAAGQNLTEAEMVDHTTFGAPTGGRLDIRARLETGPAPGLLGNGYNFTKVGGGQLIIACQRTLTNTPAPFWDLNLGDVSVNEGWLSFEENLNLGNPAKTIIVNPGATVSFRDLGLTNPVARNIIVTDANLDTTGANASTTNVFTGSILLGGNVRMGQQRCITIVNGTMSGDASLLVYAVTTAGGRLILNGANTYTGDTTVTNGTLGGYGSIAGNLVMTGGTLSPGFGVGTFTVGGNATLAGTTAMELAPGQVPNCDRLNVGGTLTAGGALVVTLAPGAAAPQSGDSFQLFNKGAVGFAGITLPTLGSGLGWDTNSLPTTGLLKVVSTVPPSIGNVSVTGGTFSFSGTGGTEGATYYIVTSPDVSAPMASWTPVATNLFGPGGSFSFSTNVVSGGSEAFFRLQLP